MSRINYLNALLVGSVSAVAITTSAFAEDFNIPGGDLKAALTAYAKQASVALIYPDDELTNARSKGAKGKLSAEDALARVLSGTGFSARRTPYGAVAVVHDSEKPQRVDTIEAAPLRLAAAAASGIESVVVTSSKIKGDIQTVPIAITALSQEQLTSRQIAGGPDLVKEVPNLTFSKTNFSGYNLQIRGIGTQAISVTTDPAVAVAFNDTPFIRNHFFEQEFFDVSQVEILRGPQGTLYGRNATAGVVNLVSAKPTDQFEAMGSADWGNFHNRRYEGMVNIPIVGDTLDLRVAGEWTKRDGYSYNETTNAPIDGRDLWSTRVTLGWKPTSDIQAYFVWEHFQEQDDRLRSGKQLCQTDFGPGARSVTDTGKLTAANGTVVTVPSASGTVFGMSQAYFSQGCLPASLYAPQSFGVPNGFSLPFISGAAYLGLINTSIDPYSQTNQSTNLRDIQSAIDPKYRARNDTLEFNASWNISPALTLSSDTGFNRDFLWSTEDYNRFDTSPGIFIPGAHGDVGSDGVFCDPQLGCSDRLVVQDLSTERAWQLSQEFRLASNLSGPLNFSAGGNFLHYETWENYYVFSNTFTLISLDNLCSYGGFGATNPTPANSAHCLTNGKSYRSDLNNLDSVPTESPQYVDPNPITSLDNEGHNYFVSQNPYVLNSYAGFGEAYLDVTPELKLTAGLRWTDDEKHIIEIPSELLVVGYGYPSIGAVDQAWHEWTGRFVANWSPKLSFTDQSMFYASYARGYKAGGANPPGAVLLNADTSCAFTNAGCGAGPVNINFPVHPAIFAPEFIDAFEAGTKNTLLDGGLTLNGDVFFYNYKGYQISEIVDRTSVNLNFDATVQGAELEATYEPVPGLKFSFAGGYEDSRIKNNQYAIDLIDRTAGTPGWVVMKPSVGQSSNCILPEYVAAALVQQYPGDYQGNLGPTACGMAYSAHIDPVSSDYYNYGGHPAGTPAGYPGFDPLSTDALAPGNVNNGLGLPPNNGEGFAKNVGGNQLPNAPHFTTSFTADYTMPVNENWAATLHGDFYWQSQSFARVFNDRPYDKIRGYSNVNAALILTDASGWQVMGYVKNIFDTTAITGDFLNSDDSGLTTNIFLTDPRLYGLRVTKHFDDGGSSGGFDLFSNTDGKPPQIWLTIGGQYSMLSDKQELYEPYFASLLPAGLPGASAVEKMPGASFDWEGQLAYQPEDSDWVMKAGIRYGRSSIKNHNHKSLPPQTKTSVVLFGTFARPCSLIGPPLAKGGICYAFFNEFTDAQGTASEDHAILDFTLGKDVGLGAAGKSTVGAGLRVAQFSTHTRAELNSDPNYLFKTSYFAKYHDLYDGMTEENRSFHGMGPEVTWDGSTPILGNTASGEITLDWGVNAAMLFGRQRASVHHQTQKTRCGYGTLSTCYNVPSPTHPAVTRSRNVTVPNLGGYAGLSVRYNDARISFGYRADEFFGAMDGGQDTAKHEGRGFYGPFMNVSVGFGG